MKAVWEFDIAEFRKQKKLPRSALAEVLSISTRTLYTYEIQKRVPSCIYYACYVVSKYIKLELTMLDIDNEIGT